MRKIQFFMKVLLFVSIALLGLDKIAYAEQVNKSVKEWLEQPEDTKQEQKSDQDQTTTKNEDTTTAENGSVNVGLTIWDFIKMIFATIFVVALLYFMLRFINKKSKNYKSSQLIENIGGTSLGGNRSVQLIKVGNQLLVVGVGESIQLLKEINNEEEYNQIIEEYNNKMEQLVQPSDFVTKVLQRAKMKKKNENEVNQFSSILKNELQNMKKTRKKLFEEMDKKGPEDQ